MTLPLPFQIEHSDTQSNFDELAQKFPLLTQNIGDHQVTAAKLAAGIVLELAATGTQRKVAFGTNQVTFTASTASAQTTVTHGLGTTPVVVLATSIGGSLITYDTLTYTSTTFKAAGGFSSAISGTFSFAWVAIG